ncbi:MAG: hypothetical protein C5B55_12865 [Blastocatellia bacterium]|nr:MAG: hypothetical protein C5B55_12865 [Blastocatellia bacterium]
MAESDGSQAKLIWTSLNSDVREQLQGKLEGLWGATSDAAAFDSLAIDKQRALLLLLKRLRAKGLWHVVQKVNNVYGEGGVGLQFAAWPVVESTLSRRSDFTRRFANHKDTTGGFYEKDRSQAVLHFLYQDGTPRVWYVHFDLYSPVYSPGSALKHLRHEFIGKLTPDWRMIAKCLKD